MKSEITGVKAAGSKAKGEIVFLFEEEKGLSGFDTKIAGKIVVGKKFSQAALAKLEALDAAAVVISEINDEVFEQISRGKTLELGEFYRLGLSLLVVDEHDLLILEAQVGKKAVLNPEEKKLSLCP